MVKEEGSKGILMVPPPRMRSKLLRAGEVERDGEEGRMEVKTRGVFDSDRRKFFSPMHSDIQWYPSSSFMSEEASEEEGEEEGEEVELGGGRERRRLKKMSRN